MALPLEDGLELQQLNAIDALRMTQGDINHIMEEVFTADGSYSAFGDTYGLADWPSLVEAAPKGLFLTGEPMLELDGDKGTGPVPLLFVDPTNHHMRMGWYSATSVSPDNGWGLRTRKVTFPHGTAAGRERGGQSV